MAVKSAKEDFNKQEIIEILRQNVTLYKDEPEFVEYIVNLALYLIDQAYTVSGERSSELADVLESFAAVRESHEEDLNKSLDSSMEDERRPEPPSSSEVELSTDKLNSEEIDREIENEPPTNKMRLQKYEAVMKAPPPPKDESRISDASLDDVPTSRLSELESTAQAKLDDMHRRREEEEKRRLGDLEDLSDLDDEPRTRQLRSVGMMTPEEAEGGLTDRGKSKERSPKIEVDDDKNKKARVYRVVRSYSASKGGDTNCPICGTDTHGASRCPSCGHII